MSNKTNKWIEQDNIVKQQMKHWIVPNENLDRVDYVDLISEKDFDKLPRSNGTYWIETNEPISHAFNFGPYPENADLIYNGITDNIRNRAKHHLFRKSKDRLSAISVDLREDEIDHHAKAAIADNKKTPYINGKQIKKIEDLHQLYLSEKESNYVETTEKTSYYFYNGINILDPKHFKYTWRVYYIPGLSDTYATFIEKEWRKTHGRPKLCSYKSGR